LFGLDVGTECAKAHHPILHNVGAALCNTVLRVIEGKVALHTGLLLACSSWVLVASSCCWLMPCMS